jgi:hypothetical protein
MYSAKMLGGMKATPKMTMSGSLSKRSFATTKAPVKVAVTGASGQIGYSLLLELQVVKC